MCALWTLTSSHITFLQRTTHLPKWRHKTSIVKDNNYIKVITVCIYICWLLSMSIFVSRVTHSLFVSEGRLYSVLFLWGLCQDRSQIKSFLIKRCWTSPFPTHPPPRNNYQYLSPFPRPKAVTTRTQSLGPEGLGFALLPSTCYLDSLLGSHDCSLVSTSLAGFLGVPVAQACGLHMTWEGVPSSSSNAYWAPVRKVRTHDILSIPTALCPDSRLWFSSYHWLPSLKLKHPLASFYSHCFLHLAPQTQTSIPALILQGCWDENIISFMVSSCLSWHIHKFIIKDLYRNQTKPKVLGFKTHWQRHLPHNVEFNVIIECLA